MTRTGNPSGFRVINGHLYGRIERWEDEDRVKERMKELRQRGESVRLIKQDLFKYDIYRLEGN